jgi:hypothetical protein
MKKFIMIIAIVLALEFIGFSRVKGHGEEPGQEKTQMTQMMENQAQMTQMMKEMNEKMDKMMNSCMGMMEKMHGSKGGMMMEHHEGMMEKK